MSKPASPGSTKCRAKKTRPVFGGVPIGVGMTRTASFYLRQTPSSVEKKTQRASCWKISKGFRIRVFQSFARILTKVIRVRYTVQYAKVSSNTDPKSPKEGGVFVYKVSSKHDFLMSSTTASIRSIASPLRVRLSRSV